LGLRSPGAWPLALPLQGIITPEGRRLLSSLVINVFTPALMLSKLSSHISLADAITLWPFAVNMLAVHLVGLGLGALHVRALGTPARLQPLVLACTSIGNAGVRGALGVPARATGSGGWGLGSGAAKAHGLRACPARAAGWG
jgi:predicted permease